MKMVRRLVQDRLDSLDSAGIERLVLIKRLELIGAPSLLFRYGENSGDSMHAEAHFGT